MGQSLYKITTTDQSVLVEHKWWPCMPVRFEGCEQNPYVLYSLKYDTESTLPGTPWFGNTEGEGLKKIVSTVILPGDEVYSGNYTILDELYNGYPQYGRDGARLYVKYNIVF